MTSSPASQRIGQPVRRKEDLRLITGRGRFSDDVNWPNQSYAVILRSPHAHARIRGIDAGKALAMDGVLAVLTGKDMLADGLKPVPHDPLPKTKYDQKLTAPDGSRDVFIGPHMLMPADKARHVGEAVAMVVAETLWQALDAAEAVDIDWEPLPFVTQSRDAEKTGAPAVWDEHAANVCVETFFGDREATDRAFARADHNRDGAAPIEIGDRVGARRNGLERQRQEQQRSHAPRDEVVVPRATAL